MTARAKSDVAQTAFRELRGLRIDLFHEHVQRQHGASVGVGRAGVTERMNLLEGVRAIKATRGSITVLDRDKLEEAARDIYGVPEAECERIIGPFTNGWSGCAGHADVRKEVSTT